MLRKPQEIRMTQCLRLACANHLQGSYLVCECRIRKWQISTLPFSHVILDCPFVNLNCLFSKVEIVPVDLCIFLKFILQSGNIMLN